MPANGPRFTVAGETYRVIVAFRDFDDQVHPVGESWQFIRKEFVPYDDGLSLFVLDAGRERQIRLQWRPASQGSLIDRFAHFVETA